MNNTESFSIHQTKNQYFTQIWNYVTTDLRLKPNARLILIYMKSKPNYWVPRRKDMEENMGLKGNTLNRVLTNLEEFGYLERVRFQDEKGFWRTSYKFYFDPGENENYHGEMPKGYFIIGETSKNPNKKNPIAGQQMGGEQKQQTTSTPNITQEPTKYKKKSKIDEKYKDDVSEFGFVD